MFLLFKSSVLLFKGLMLSKKNSDVFEKSSDADFNNSLTSMFTQMMLELEKSSEFLATSVEKEKHKAIIVNATTVWVNTVGASNILFTCGNWSQARQLITEYTDYCVDTLRATQWEKASHKLQAQKAVESFRAFKESMLGMLDVRETLIALEQDPSNPEMQVRMQELKAKFNTMNKTATMDPRAEKALIHLYFKEDDLAQKLIDQMELVDSQGKNHVLYEKNINSGLVHYSFGKTFLDLLQSRLESMPSTSSIPSLSVNKRT